MKKRRYISIIVIIFLIASVIFAVLPMLPSSLFTGPIIIPERENLIPEDAVKMDPENDEYPPQLQSNEYEDPIPLPYPVNTRGGEDSAFIMPDGNTLYIWFTPNNKMDAVEQSRHGYRDI